MLFGWFTSLQVFFCLVYHIWFTATFPENNYSVEQGLWVYCVQDLLFSNTALSPPPPHKTIWNNNLNAGSNINKEISYSHLIIVNNNHCELFWQLLDTVMICHTKYVFLHHLKYLLLLETRLSSYFVSTHSATVDFKQVVSMSLNAVR